MKKLFKSLSIGLLLVFFAAAALSFSGCAAKSANLSSTENTEAKTGTASYAVYEGKYQLAPNFIITVTTKEDRLYAQATAQQKFEIYPESVDKFYYKVVAAKIKFNRNTSGKVDSLTLYQNGQEMPGKKLEM